MASILSRREEGGILVLTISNEARRNAFTHEMTHELGAQLQAAEQDPATRCVIITGAGDVAFSSGHDLREMLEDRDGASDPVANAPFVMPANMRTPTIAAVNGYAFAVGFILSISCDLRICAENASFSAPGARIGLLPIGGQLSRLPMLMPRGVAHDMLISCRTMQADEAHRLGFANRLVPRGQALDAALETARQIVANSHAVVTAIKTGLETLATDGTVAAENYEWETARRLQSAPDAQEGMLAFLEKRSPRFM
ncbi:enoyl-CoA hydratase/isomerase family protein [Parapusillimonas sp. SGNA-6]|nr:enoyl-CoA hydratase/isomerase family protein [Parapusillimonas sp. SGNA-6]